MLLLFRRNLFLNSLMLLPYVFVVSIASLLQPQSIDFDNADSLIFSFFERLGISDFSFAILSCLLVFVQAMIINRMVSKNNYDRSLSLFPGMFYILFVGLHPQFFNFNPAILANTFLILSLYEINKLYKVYRPSSIIFNAGLYMGIAIVCYLPSIYYLIVIMIGMLSLRAFNVKEILQLLAGFLISLFIVLSTLYISDPSIDLAGYFLGIISLSDIVLKDFLIILPLLLWIVVLVISARTLLIKKSIDSSKKISMLYYALISSPLLLITGSAFSDPSMRLLTLMIPVGILSGLLFASIKNKLVAEFMHIMILAIAFAIQFDLMSYIK